MKWRIEEVKEKSIRLKELQKLGIADKNGVVNYAKYTKYKSIQKGYGYDIVIKISWDFKTFIKIIWLYIK